MLFLVILCPLREPPLNGGVDCTNGVFFDSICSYTCDAGYFLSGADESTCLIDGTWSSGVPTCVRITCLPPHTAPIDGSVNCTASNNKNSSHKNFMRRIRKVHFVGIGGAGMSGIADVMHTLGYQVSGSDIASNAVTERLQNLGVKVFHSHTAENIIDVDVVVTSTAINTDNVEVAA